MGALASLQTLGLSSNSIGDAGLTAFATSLSKGALAQLKELHLYNNKIGDAGLTAFASSLSKGALASLKQLMMDVGWIDHPKLKAVCQERGISLE